MVDEHHAFVWRSLRRLGVPGGAVDDSVQQVFIVASQRLGDIRADREAAFLFGTAVRVAANARRGLGRRQEVPLDDAQPEELASRSGSAEEILCEESDRRVLDDILDALPVDLRTVFILFELDEMTTPAIARMLDISVGTAASRLRRAREIVTMQIARARARLAAAASKETQ
jgi:RNA polymerase sigma-70 factor (ECF subfamily)